MRTNMIFVIYIGINYAYFREKEIYIHVYISLETRQTENNISLMII
jgi:hypothetical protein